MTADSNEIQNARCWGCDYLLRGVESTRCPECGREFDRADPASMNHSRAIGRAGRWMLGRLGSLTNLIAFAGALLVLWTTPWAVKGWHFSLVDLQFYAPFWQWRDRRPGMSGIDAAYTIGLFLTTAIFLWWLMRLTLRTFALIYYRPARQLRGRFWGRSILLLIMVGITIAGIGVGWPYRIGQRWTHEWEVAAPLASTVVYVPPLLQITGADVPLSAVILKGRTPRERRYGMKLLLEASFNVNIDFPQHLREMVEHETDLETRVFAIHVAALTMQGELEPFLIRRLQDPSTEIRIAAADALAIFWNTAAIFDSSVGAVRRIPGGDIAGDPTIELNGAWGAPKVSKPQAARDRLESMMVNAATLEEREAAAKALIYAPSAGFQFRYAEWGVMIGEGPGKVRFTNALRDDVPPFVHKVGNPASEFEDRIFSAQPAGMGKPVVHLTVDRPVAVQLEINMNNGRPWFAYPLFDDLVLLKGEFDEIQAAYPGAQTLGPRRSIRMFDPKGIPSLSNLREGYSWFLSQGRDYPRYDYSARGGSPLDPDALSDYSGIGMFWQSLIVTPQPLPGSRLADVPSDAKYEWWKRLRQTPCSWISSRGESERFLYYDGPTIMSAPVIMKLDADKLSWTQSRSSWRSGRPPGYSDPEVRSAIFVEVRDGKIKGFWIDDDSLASDSYETISEKMGPLSIWEFTAQLMKHGLKPPEAQALMACWQKTFFETEGRRTLVIMSEADYEAICPMTIRPWPTELARVGIIWTEFEK